MTPEPVQPQSTTDFLDSVGVNIHSSYTDTPYWDHDRLLSELERSGIQHVRDALVVGREEEQRAFLEQLAEQGMCAQIIFGGAGKSQEDIERMVEVAGSLKEAISAFEGPNELDLSDEPDWPDMLREQQRMIAELKESDPALEDMPLVGPSFGRLRSWDRAGDLSSYLELGNLHPYPGGEPPEGALDRNVEVASLVAGAAPLLTSETGYHDAVANEDGQPGVPRDVEAAYLPRLLLHAFGEGIVRTYLYEFVDEFEDPDDSDDQASFGLLTIDWDEKPAARSVYALLDILGDGDALAEPETADLSPFPVAVRTDEGESVEALLLAEKEAYWLALWQSESLWDTGDEEMIDVTAREVDVLLESPASITIYRPLEGSDPVRTHEGRAEVPITLPADVVLLRIER